MPRAEILSTQAMHTLRQLHAELAGKLIDNKSEARRLTRSMQQVEAVMKLLDPSYNVSRIAVRRRKPNPWFKKGTVFRSALEVLRETEGPLTTKEITRRMVAAKGVQNPDRQALRDMAGGVQSSLRNHRGKSVVVVGQGIPSRWALIREA
jgi:hypothetical protein